MRLVIDTDVLVAAIRSRKGASAALLARLIEGYAIPLVGVALALEYEATALLPEHVMAGGTTTAIASNVIDTLLGIAEPVEVTYQYRPQLSDPGDEMVLETAINGQADAIVSFNHRDYHKDGRNIAHQFGIDVISPAEALQRLRSRTV